MGENFRKVINKMRAAFMSDSCKFFFSRQLKKNVRRPKPEALRIKKALGLEPLPSRGVQVVARAEKRIARLMADDEDTVASTF